MEREWNRICAKRIRSGLNQAGADFCDRVEELRLRVGQPLAVTMENGTSYLTAAGQLTARWEEALIVTETDLAETMEYVSSYSRYAYAEELRQGFITVRGGHRVGFCGKTVITDGKVRGPKYIQGLNIRVARQVPGCADAVYPLLYAEGLCHVLLVSPPGCGKTTLLRDLVRRLSDGSVNHPGLRVSLVDERSEIAACYQGIPQNDVGRNTDVLDGCPKAEGMMLMIRTMNPEVLAVDEIGARADLNALEQAVTCGCRVLATAHAGSWAELCSKPGLDRLLRERLFRHFVFLERTDSGRVRWRVLTKQGEEAAWGWR
ncbi:MAG: stage III sporulation protein AA [Lachnospiraceae bacterium]|nr:stage III sporulation protein AA [Lachnospiraceae bacterium]